jgi:hypothetical protein
MIWAGIFLFNNIQASSVVHPSSYSVCTCGSFPRIDQLEYEVDHSPLFIAEVKNGWSVTPLLQYILKPWYSSKRQFYLHLYLMGMGHVYLGKKKNVSHHVFKLWAK